MTILNSVFRNRSLRLALLVILIQQAMIATGTYLMGEMAAKVTAEGLNARTLIAFVACVIFPGSLIHYAVVKFATQATKSELLAYLRKYAQSNFNHPGHWRNTKSRETRHDIMCRSGQEAIQSSIHFLIDVASTSLNILFNTVSVMLATDRALGAAIAVAGLLGLWIVHLGDRRISENSQAEMLADTQLNAHLARSWDNIILGNSLHFGRWMERLERFFFTSRQAALASVRSRDWIVAVAGFITTALVVFTAIALALWNRSNPGLGVALLVMLPRSLQIVMHIQIVQGYWAQWKSLREKLDLTDATLSPPDAADLKRYIQLDKIEVQTRDGSWDGFGNADLRSSILSGLSGLHGRFTLLGPNGAGKSTLLLDLKARLGERAVYLPTAHQLEPLEQGESLSSGQSAQAFLTELARRNDAIVLLDEWDANLSEENRIAQSMLIDEISQTRTVIEVRHPRGTSAHA